VWHAWGRVGGMCLMRRLPHRTRCSLRSNSSSDTASRCCFSNFTVSKAKTEAGDSSPFSAGKCGSSRAERHADRELGPRAGTRPNRASSSTGRFDKLKVPSLSRDSDLIPWNYVEPKRYSVAAVYDRRTGSAAGLGGHRPPLQVSQFPALGSVVFQVSHQPAWWDQEVCCALSLPNGRAGCLQLCNQTGKPWTGDG
jgi:hypothetical protein